MRMLHGSIFSLTRAQVWILCSYFITMALEDTTACLFLACYMVGQQICPCFTLCSVTAPSLPSSPGSRDTQGRYIKLGFALGST